MTGPCIVNIHYTPPTPGERAHILNETCWCAPVVTHFDRTHSDGVAVVINHSGHATHAVQASLSAEEWFGGLSAPKQTIRGGTGARITAGLE